jgi:hypothetical protein
LLGVVFGRVFAVKSRPYQYLTYQPLTSIHYLSREEEPDHDIARRPARCVPEVAAK